MGVRTTGSAVVSLWLRGQNTRLAAVRGLVLAVSDVWTMRVRKVRRNDAVRVEKRTDVSATTVTFLGLHLLVDQPEGMLRQDVSLICVIFR